jgi:ABC-type uncharacterized transport system permease subunit
MGKLLKTYQQLIITLLVSFGTILVLLIFGSGNPILSIQAFFIMPLSNRFFLGNLLESAGYMYLAGLGVSLAFRGGSFNLGGEGQVYTGAFFSAVVLSLLPGTLGMIGLIFGLGIGLLAGGLLAGISAVLKKSLGINDLISSYLLSLGLIPVYDSLIAGPLRDSSVNLLTTRRIPSDFWLSKILPPSQLHSGILLSLLLGLVTWWLLWHTRLGYRLRLSGSNPLAAKLSGIPADKITLGAFTLSGAFHGLAGSLAVLGSHHAALVGITAGVGWNGIAAALIGRSHPLGTLFGALLFAYLQAGSRSAMIHTRFSSELAIVVQGLVLLLVTAQLIRPKRTLSLPDDFKEQSFS